MASGFPAGSSEASLAKSSEASPAKFYGWKLLAAHWVILFAVLGWPPYGAGIVNTWMAEDLGFDRTMLGVPYSVLSLMSGLPGPLVALLVTRKGTRFAMVAGSLTLLAACLYMALVADSFWEAVFGAGVVAGAGIVMGGALPVQTSTMRWFVRRRALAFAIILSAGGIGGMFAPPALNYVISSTGTWRAGWAVFAAFALLAVIVAMLFARERPSDLGQHPDGVAPGVTPVAGAVAVVGAAAVAGAVAAKPARADVHKTTEAWTGREAVRSPTLWLLLFCACGMSMAFTWFLSHGVAHLQDLGHTKNVAAFAASSMAATTLLGKFTVGVLGDRIEPRFLFAASLALFAVGVVLVTNAHGTAALWAFGICLGIGWGGGLTCLMTLMANYYGSQAYPTAVGVTLAVQPTVSAISPALSGYLYDAYGSYAPTLYSLAALCFVSALLMTRARPPVRPAR
jgi:MFS family permease